MNVFLVSCVSKKRDYPCPASQLYASEWFYKARDYATLRADGWYILSARNFLLHPGDIVRPYDLALNAMPVLDRRAWAWLVAEQVEQCIPAGSSLTVLAGRRYREFLLPLLEERYAIAVPMAGLGIGQQLAWLKCRVEEAQKGVL